MAANAGNHSILDEINRVRCASIFGLTVVVIVGNPSVRIEGYVFQDAAKAKSVPYLWLVFSGELDALGIASALEVEDPVCAPAVFVIANQVARRIGRECGLAGAGQSEKQRGHSIVAHICRALHG